MLSNMIKEALNVVYTYMSQRYSKDDIDYACKELRTIANCEEYSFSMSRLIDAYSYSNVQNMLSTLNEKESIRKNKGVYYTPYDVVQFILYNSIKLMSGKLSPSNLHVLDLNGIPYKSFCETKTVYDPTCGAGEFLLSSLRVKYNMLETNSKTMTNKLIKQIIGTINGNDINPDSVIITKIRLYLCSVHRYGVKKCEGLSNVLNEHFTCYDFIKTIPNKSIKYDIIIGNPPYVEDSKSGLDLDVKYGNIYANTLKNAAMHLETNGTLGFIIPLSYVSTPRMRKIRNDLFDIVSEQYILSYCDRPDCLFTSVHQKLCILLGKNNGRTPIVYTSNYQYWYKEERAELFSSITAVKNQYVQDEYIPKLGNLLDNSIYKKIHHKSKSKISLYELANNGSVAVFLNMRAAFWIKAFKQKHNGTEYKEFKCKNADIASYVSCLLNSSLFWWYWICVSDCWHITNKELIGFLVPVKVDYNKMVELSNKLETMLENTKVYVGTKQTDYEYKHKECVSVIHEIDDYINQLFGLNDAESVYIKNFAYRYRIGGGIDDAKKRD